MLRIVPRNGPRVDRSYEHFPDDFELHLLQLALSILSGRLPGRRAKAEPSTCVRAAGEFWILGLGLRVVR